MLSHQYNYYQKLQKSGNERPGSQKSHSSPEFNKKTSGVELIQTLQIFFRFLGVALLSCRFRLRFVLVAVLFVTLGFVSWSTLDNYQIANSNAENQSAANGSVENRSVENRGSNGSTENGNTGNENFVELDVPLPKLLMEAESAQADEQQYQYDDVLTKKVSINHSKNQSDTPAPLAQLPEESEAWLEFKIKKGDTLSALFNRAGLPFNDLTKLLESDAGSALQNIVAGRQITLLKNAQGELQRLHYPKDAMETLVFARGSDQQFHVTRQVKFLESLLDYAEGEIDMSLFIDGGEAGLSDNLIMNLAAIFAWDIDFTQDIHPGDSFRVLYKKQFMDGVPTGKGQILAATFMLRGEEKTAIYYSNQHGESSYFTKDGHNLRKRFLRMPLDFGRISSGFNLARMHPVLNRIRAHRGTDYAAPRHTPIKSTGSGQVIFAGWSNGYGRNVIINHGNGYTTLYGHMQKIGVAKGQRVKQGEVIGTVGTSGLATGPHVHYEFRVHGVHKDPAKVKLPGALALTGKEKRLFNAHKEELFRQKRLMQRVVAHAGK